MTTYSAVASGEVDSDSPVTDTLMGKLANNPVAIAEADSSVPLSLLPTVLLGTMTTTSGSSKTISSLVLTPYKFLLFSLNAVSTTSAGVACTVGSAGDTEALTGPPNTISGTVLVDLTTGFATAMTHETGGNRGVKVGATGYTTATTSVVVSTSATFDAGSIKVYGLK
jgi:hypothetical protein